MFFDLKVYVDLKYHTNHIPGYCIYKVASCFSNLNMPYIALLGVEINLAILSKMSVINNKAFTNSSLSSTKSTKPMSKFKISI